MDATTALGFSHFLAQTDGLARSILVLMLGASIVSWYLIVTKTITFYATRRQSHRFLRAFAQSATPEALAMHLDDGANEDPFARVAREALAASRHHDARGGSGTREESNALDLVTRALSRALDAETARMEGGLTVLASIGATAPFVGLLGTVWGIYRALIEIGMSGAGTLDKVAGPVGEALIMTALGLAVAIPAVLGYNFMVRSNRLMVARLDGFAHDVYALIATGARLQTVTVAKPVFTPAFAVGD